MSMENREGGERASHRLAEAGQEVERDAEPELRP
jgi:hypothetical protein